MNNYQDQYTRWHNKPVTDTDPYPCNNAFLYSAYSLKAGLSVNDDKLTECWSDCWKNQENFATRNPNQVNPPFSRDEILGAVSVGVLQSIWLESHNWNFSHYSIPKFSLTKLLSQLWQLRPSIELCSRKPNKYSLQFKHRNYFWQNNLDQLYRFAFSVPLQDRYFILQKWNSFKWYKPSHILYLTIAKIDAKLSPSGLRYLKYGGDKNKAKMLEEFPSDHPITKV